MIVGGYFNCVLARTDVTDHLNYSLTLNELVQVFDLVDMWATAPKRGVYTHYTRHGVSRLDRIYVSRNLSGRKCGTEAIMTAFTDHLAVVLRIALNVTTVRPGRYYWKMNAALLRETPFLETLRQRWAGCVRQQKHYPNVVVWWERVAKKQLRHLFTREGTERRRDDTALEDFYHTCLYDLLQTPPPGGRDGSCESYKGKICKTVWR